MKTDVLRAKDTTAGEFVPPEPAELNALLPDYEVVELVGCGGTGAVYRAQHVALRREVAIKVLPTELSQFEEFQERFKSEARAMAQLTHPNLMAVYDFGEVAGMLYLVMEFVRGDSLFAAAHGQVIDPIQAVELVAGVAAGLGHAHRAGILHRDINPANILITEDLVPKLGDFGLADSAGEADAGVLVGDPAYMAPEVLRDPNEATPASDVFSLGMILHELLTGIEPTSGEPANLARVPALTHLSDLVRKAVIHSPTMRYRDSWDMAVDLCEWLEEAGHMLPYGLAGAEAPAGPVGGVFELPQAGPHYSPIVSKRKTGGGVAAVLAVGTVLLVGGGLILYFGDRGQQQPAPSGKAPADPPVVAPVVVSTSAPTLAPGPKPGPADPEPASDFDLEAHRGEMRDSLRSARALLLEQRATNAQALREKAGASPAWNRYFTLVDHARGGLARFLTEDDKVVLDEKMVELLNHYAVQEQRKLDRAHVTAVKSLFRSSVSTLEEAGALPEGTQASSWEGWIEWLGMSPMEVLALDPAGTWEIANGPAVELGTTLVIGRDGAVMIAHGGAEVAGTLSEDEAGHLTIARENDDRFWKLGWRSEWLKGMNETGTPVRFRRKAFRFIASH